MNTLGLSVVFFAAIYLSMATVEKRFPTNRNGDKMTNVVRKDGFLYVAENGFLHQLDLGLSSLKSFNTCVSDNCYNINKVLAVSGDLLVLCGSGNNGVCQALNGSEVQYSSSSDSSDENYLAVSTNIGKSAVGLAFEGDFYLGVSYGQDMGTKTISGTTYKYYISRTVIDKSFTPKASVYLLNEEYPVYFKKVFQHDRYIYFLTNQSDIRNSTKFVSKLIRICVDEEYNQKQIKSYTDISLSCGSNSGNYNLLQDADFLPAKGVLVAAFSQGDDPKHPTADSFVCVYTMEAVNNAILAAKEDYITCGTKNYSEVQASAYIELDLLKCLSNDTYISLSKDYICPKAPSVTGIKVIGFNPPLQPNSTNKLDNTKITKVKGIDRYGLYPDVFIGTDSGTISKLSVDDSLQVHMYETNTVINEGHPVTDILIGEDKAYIVTNKKISSYKNPDCSSQKTCKETLKFKNPSCGWCLVKNKSTKKSECPQGWISSLSECVSIDVSPKYIAESEVATSNLTITAKNVPPDVTTEMRCRYLNNSQQIGGTVNAFRIRENTFSCSINSKPKLVELTVHLVAFEKSKELFTYAETTIQIYKCDSYRTCGNCLQSPNINCHWCGTELTCQDTTLSCAHKVTTNSNCTRLESSEVFLPNGITQDVTLTVANMVSGVDYVCTIKQNERDFDFTATKVNNNVMCELNVSFDMDGAKSIMVLSVSQKKSSTKARIENSVNVTVYKCEHLALDCTKCKALNPNRYNCNWCQSNQIRKCGHSSVCSQSVDCPKPKIIKVSPSLGGYKGNTEINITGTDFGTSASSIDKVKVGEEKCESLKIIPATSNDIDPAISINDIIVCTIGPKDDITRLGVKNVTFDLDGVQAGSGKYTFANPVVANITPSFGPAIGGTLITLSGTYLGIERDVPTVKIDVFGFCTDVLFFNELLTCTTPLASVKNVSKITLKWNGQLYNSTVFFRYLQTPNITEVGTGKFPGKSILSGGTKLLSNGIGLKNAATVIVTAEYAGDVESTTCVPSSDTSMSCNLPKAPNTAIKEMKENVGEKRKKRSMVDESISIKISIKMDGYLKKFDIDYFRDPELEKFQETTTVFKSGERRLMITGNYLNLVGGAKDYSVLIGNGNCLVIEVTRSNITCIPPQDSPNKTAEIFEVVVQLGNFKKEVGYVRYEIVTLGASLQNIVIIVVPIVVGLVLIGIIAGGIGTCKYQRVKGKAKIFEKNLVDMEMKIKKVFREEFLDMHTTMSRVNENLIEKGFPYNNYQRYTFLMLFPGEWHMEEHPLMHEPVVSDSIRFKLKKGMDTFEQLLLNKFFLVSVISTMEKQRKFFLKERSNMAGHLSIALLGRMDYFHEILVLLLTTLIDETPQKQQKTLFRRCESITEKLLSSWLVLGLYYHVKMHSGSPLYMLLKGTQLTMESGPIDAVTGDSKYTLSEDKLLRQDDKNTTLTLKVLVENSDEVRECKVLDCDTISQVKAKCLSQIYVNYPASQLTVDSSELNLEWHWGSGGRLVIKDEDTTSKRDGDWLQLNTLEHYKVVDGSSMALVDPNGLIDQEDYVNLAHIKIDADVGDGSIHSNEPLTHKDLENGEPITRWHLVKSDEEKQSTGCVVTDELYLNRLITTKQSVLEYMRNLFDTILNPTIPPPAKFLFDFLDKAGEKNKVDVDALHAWKSQCYTIRFWATLINKPYNLFDQKIPSYVETSMEVISQVLIESCSLKGHQYTKDSSPGKLIFKNDMMTYRDRVKEYYTQVKATNQTPEDLRQYLTDLNHNQNKETHYNRHAALYSLYCQLQPYMEWIIEDLEDNEDTKSLHLDRKLASLNEQMEEE